MVVEEMVLAKEIGVSNQKQLKQIKELAPMIPIHYLSHEEFKEQTKKSKVIIRTGEATPYSNVILQAGVIF